MTFGISRVHGSLIAPKNLAGVALQDFTLTFWGGDVQAAGSSALSADWNGGAGTAGGAFDQIFRTATGAVGTVSRVGTMSTATRTVRFAIESLGFESSDNSGGGYLGTGPTDASPANTAAALEAAIQALGTVNGVHLSSATVAAFVY